MRAEPTVTRLAAEHRDGLGVGVAEPRLSWVVEGPDGWCQAGAEVRIDGERRVPAAPVVDQRRDHRPRVHGVRCP